MKKNILVSALLATCFIFTSSAVYADDSDTTSQDRKFLEKAAQDSLAVERLGQLASQQGQNPQVRQLGQKLAADYAREAKQLIAMGQTIGVTVPSELDRRSAREINKLESLSGAEFDQAALRELVKSEQAVTLKIQDEAAKGTNTQVKTFASTTLPPLQDDIYQVVRLQSDLKVTAAAGNPQP